MRPFRYEPREACLDLPDSQPGRCGCKHPSDCVYGRARLRHECGLLKFGMCHDSLHHDRTEGVRKEAGSALDSCCMLARASAFDVLTHEVTGGECDHEQNDRV